MTVTLQGNERILFVDDEEMLTNIGSILLESFGYKVTKKVNAPEAIDTCRAHPENFDLVITDQTMPDMTGAELSTELLRIRPDIPIILCTGSDQTVAQETALELLGIREFCYKPYDRKQIAITVRKVLDENEQARYL